MIFMKISNKVLSEMVFSHRRVCYYARYKNVEKNTFLHVALAKCKKTKKNKNKKKKNEYKKIIIYILHLNDRYQRKMML